MLGKGTDPEQIYYVYDAKKSYSIVDVTKTRAMLGNQREEEFSVTKLGFDTVAGYRCERALITTSKGGEFEGCFTSQIVVGGAWIIEAPFGGYVGSYSGWTRALKDIGVGSFPVRIVMRDKNTNEQTLRMELVRAKKKSVPSSMFEIPAGYRDEAAPIARPDRR